MDLQKGRIFTAKTMQKALFLEGLLEGYVS
jgi:hypothetical protein